METTRASDCRLTAWDYCVQLLDAAGVDLILVGDLATVLRNNAAGDLRGMLHHAKAALG